MNDLALAVGSLCGLNSGPLSLCGKNPDESANIFSSVLSMIIGIMTVIAGIWFIFILVTGAISLITSEGDKAAIETARKKITSGAIGLVLVIAGIFIIDLLGSLIGFDILNPAEFILNPPR